MATQAKSAFIQNLGKIYGGYAGGFIGFVIILGILEQMSGFSLTGVARGVDGCGIPTIAFPIGHHAFAMAQFADPHHLPEARAEACRRIARAMTTEPWYVAGTNRFCTKVMEVTGAKAAIKTGAEGVYMGALPELGLGVCIKVADGGGRAAEVAMGAVLRHWRVPTWQVLVLHLLHPAELDPTLRGEIELQDSETSERANYDLNADALERYQKFVSGWCEAAERTCFERRATYARVQSDWPVEQAVLPYLRRRGVVQPA